MSSIEARYLLCNWTLSRDLPIDILDNLSAPDNPDSYPLPPELKDANTRKPPKSLNFKKSIPLDYVAVQLTAIDFNLFQKLKRKDLFRFVEEIDEFEDFEDDILIDIRDDYNKVWYNQLIFPLSDYFFFSTDNSMDCYCRNYRRG